MAKEEACQISVRTKASLASAKARGIQLGNPRLEEFRASSLEHRRAAASQHAAKVLPIIRDIQTTGTKTLTGIAEALNRRGIPTSRGGAWEATQIRRLLVRQLS